MLLELDDADLSKVRRSIFVLVLFSIYNWWFAPSFSPGEILGMRPSSNSEISGVTLSVGLLLVSVYLTLRLFLQSRAAMISRLNQSDIDERMEVARKVLVAIEERVVRLENLDMKVSDVVSELVSLPFEVSSLSDSVEMIKKYDSKIEIHLAFLREQESARILDKQVFRMIEKEEAQGKARGLSPVDAEWRRKSITFGELKDILQDLRIEHGRGIKAAERARSVIEEIDRVSVDISKTIESYLILLGQVKDFYEGHIKKSRRYFDSADLKVVDQFQNGVRDDLLRFAKKQIPIGQDTILSFLASWVAAVVSISTNILAIRASM